MICRTSLKDPDWAEKAFESMDEFGHVVVEDALDLKSCREFSRRMDAVKKLTDADAAEYGRRLDSGRTAFVPLMMKYDPYFYKALEIEPIHQLLERYIAPNMILRNIIGQPVDPFEQQPEDTPMQHDYHRNFRHLNNVRRLSAEVAIPFVDLTAENGAFYAIPGSHRFDEEPTYEFLKAHEELIPQPVGSLLFLDGMTWHREDRNRTDVSTGMIVMQFTYPIIKQFFDYARALDGPDFDAQSERTKRLLGGQSLVPTSLQEFCTFGRTRSGAAKPA
jgi:Protein involved in biosynthesis of mitomycin antibiotics/polyketide fumonisin